jgi:hypothetical protein
MTEIDTSTEACRRIAQAVTGSAVAHNYPLAATLRAIAAERDAAKVAAANNWQHYLDFKRAADRYEADRDRLAAENADLKISVIAFGAPWAVQWARDFGMPDGYLHPEHYDLLAKCGARMDDFTRAAIAGDTDAK